MMVTRGQHVLSRQQMRWLLIGVLRKEGWWCAGGGLRWKLSVMVVVVVWRKVVVVGEPRRLRCVHVRGIRMCMQLRGWVSL
jgi:hypothetical protein